MARPQANIPKFGEWKNTSGGGGGGDGGSTAYTMYFENARAKKQGGPTINPNDPKQNPAAFGGAPRHPQPGTSGAPAVPKFGEWDENEPDSGAKFTGIFTRVKEDAANPQVPTPPRRKPNAEPKKARCCIL